MYRTYPPNESGQCTLDNQHLYNVCKSGDTSYLTCSSDSGYKDRCSACNNFGLCGENVSPYIWKEFDCASSCEGGDSGGNGNGGRGGNVGSLLNKHFMCSNGKCVQNSNGKYTDEKTCNDECSEDKVYKKLLGSGCDKKSDCQSNRCDDNKCVKPESNSMWIGLGIGIGLGIFLLILVVFILNRKKNSSSQMSSM